MKVISFVACFALGAAATLAYAEPDTVMTVQPASEVAPSAKVQAKHPKVRHLPPSHKIPSQSRYRPQVATTEEKGGTSSVTKPPPVSPKHPGDEHTAVTTEQMAH